MACEIIDAHHHMTTAPGYVDDLLKECDKMGISKVFLIAPLQEGGNSMLASELSRHSDRLCGFAIVDWEKDDPESLDRYREDGFFGLKFIAPPSNYSDQRWYPLYERAEDLRMPGLFHLGIVSRTAKIGASQGPATKEDTLKPRCVDSNMMRPIYLDTLARAFPTWQIIGAHLGNPWYEEATMSCRWNPNLFFDLSGSTLKKKSPEFLSSLLWWTPYTRYKDPEGHYAWQKIIFGSDVSFFEVRDVINDYEKLMAALNLTPELQRCVFSGTAQKIIDYVLNETT